MEPKRDRLRAANFSKGEERLLLKLVNMRSSVIENKKTDVVTNSMKVREWHKITELFNSQNIEQSRDAGTLKRKYENLKRGVKRKLGKGKKSLNKKGRDPKLILTFNEEENNLLRIIGHQGIGLESRYGDGTKVMSDQVTKSFLVEPTERNISETIQTAIIKLQADSIGQSDIVQVTSSPMVVPQDFKRPFSPSNKDEPLVGAGTKEPEASSSKGDSFDPKLAKPLNRSPHSALRYRKSFQYRPLDKVRAWAVYKAISAKNEEVFKERLHQQKMKCLEEEHDLKIQILEQQIRHAEEQQSWLREEHIAKLERIKSTK